ncbi:MAG: hypothetical protein AYP45_04180 [Candidatus Brocadia carolinensis]|uniref:Uncharacterized protein n=1 Tax=Candidatus Brocadia carolinensis TaxID=1004156 RepID=A0A1V4AW64_9BACT|nr:MAG: hypothetical protein AYP45_04180 [Candidatus Brocadia caroliniensis]
MFGLNSNIWTFKFYEEYNTNRGKKTTENQAGEKWEEIYDTWGSVTRTVLDGQVVIHSERTRGHQKGARDKCTALDG